MSMVLIRAHRAIALVLGENKLIIMKFKFVFHNKVQTKFSSKRYTQRYIFQPFAPLVLNNVTNRCIKCQKNMIGNPAVFPHPSFIAVPVDFKQLPSWHRLTCTISETEDDVETSPALTLFPPRNGNIFPKAHLCPILRGRSKSRFHETWRSFVLYSKGSSETSADCAPASPDVWIEPVLIIPRANTFER